MPNNDTWNGIIVINGGDVLPTKLEDRELFLQTQSKYLYAGFGSTIDTVRVKMSDETKKINKSWLNIDISGNTPVFKIGNFTYNGNNFTASDNSTYTLDKPTITDLNKLVLSTQMYGTTLPVDGKPGQVFFKIG